MSFLTAPKTYHALCAGMLSLFLFSCGKKLDEAECHQLLERYVELLVLSEEPDAGSEEIRKKQGDAQAKANQTDEFGKCPSEVSRKQFECAVQAPNADRFEQCLVL